MFGGNSSSSTTQVDGRRIVGTGGILISQEQVSGDSQLVVDFRDEAATNAATSIASQSIVTTQDIGLLALELADRASDQGEIAKLLIIGAITIGTAYILTRAVSR
jgi:hypothetical protein